MKNLADVAVRNEIEQRLTNLRVDTPRRWGKMTASQMVCHLSDSFRGVIGEKPLSQMSGLYPRTLLKWLALYAPMPWAHGLKTMPEMDQFAGGTQPTEFAADVVELRRLLARFTEQPRAFEWIPHPFFLQMPDREWMRWGYLHLDHHFRQFGI